MSSMVVDDMTWHDSDGTTYNIYKMEAVVGSFGNDAQKAYDACAQHSSDGKPLGAYTDMSNGGTYNFDDCDGKIYMLQTAAGMPGNDVEPNLIIDVFPSDAMIVNYNSCLGHNIVPGAPKYFYTGTWSNDVPPGAKLICAVPVTTFPSRSPTHEPSQVPTHGPIQSVTNVF